MCVKVNLSISIVLCSFFCFDIVTILSEMEPYCNPFLTVGPFGLAGSIILSTVGYLRKPIFKSEISITKFWKLQIMLSMCRLIKISTPF